MAPKTGDILVSNRRATVVHDLSIVPEPPHITCRNHDAAVKTALELAAARGVDVWLTEDHTHFLRVASFRQDTVGGPIGHHRCPGPVEV